MREAEVDKTPGHGQARVMGLRRQRVNQVAGKSRKTCGAGRVEGVNRTLCIMQASEKSKFVVVERLNADAETVDADAAKRARVLFGERTRIAFNGDLGVGDEGEPLTKSVENAAKALDCPKTRSSAADEDADEAPFVEALANGRHARIELRDHGIGIGFARNGGTLGLVRNEVAVRALFEAPGEVDVNGGFAHGRFGAWYL